MDLFAVLPTAIVLNQEVTTGIKIFSLFVFFQFYHENVDRLYEDAGVKLQQTWKITSLFETIESDESGIENIIPALLKRSIGLQSLVK